MDLESNFEKIYRTFRLNIYRKIFEVLGEREGSLNATGFFAVEAIGLMNEPTVGEFAECLSITSSNAAYKVRQLIKKGYVIKVPTDDKRSFRLRVTDKFTRYYHSDNSYGSYIFRLISQSLDEEEIEQTNRLFEKFVRATENRKGDKND